MLGKVICAGLFHGSLSIVDDWIYPYIYNMSRWSVSPMSRSFTLSLRYAIPAVGFILALLIYCSRRRPARYLRPMALYQFTGFSSSAIEGSWNYEGIGFTSCFPLYLAAVRSISHSFYVDVVN